MDIVLDIFRIIFGLIVFLGLVSVTFYTALILYILVRIIGRLLRLNLNFKYRNKLKDLTKGLDSNVDEQSEETIVAYKYAFMVLSSTKKIFFRSIVQKNIFPTTTYASCRYKKNFHGDEAVPSSKCCCGLYALKEAHRLINRVAILLGGDFRQTWLLQVRLSGKMIEGPKGFRAARQDVLCAWAPKRCFKFGCKAHAIGFIHRRIPHKPFYLVPVCSKHIVGNKKYVGPLLTLNDLRNELHTEFEWML